MKTILARRGSAVFTEPLPTTFKRGVNVVEVNVTA